MLTEEEVNHQRSLLATYRDNTKHLLLQAAQHGGEHNAPLPIANNLREQRIHIQRIKDILRTNSVFVEDHPDDMPSNLITSNSEMLLEVNGCDYFDNDIWRIFNFILRNKGRTTLYACRGQITLALLQPFAISEEGMTNDATIQTGSAAALNEIDLYWSRPSKPIEISIHPGQAERLSIARARSRSAMEQAAFSIPVVSEHDQPRIVFSGKGCEFMVKVFAENTQPVIAFGRLLWSSLNPTIEISEGPTELFKSPYA